MPHAVIECSENLAPMLRKEYICQKAFAAMDKSGLFVANDIKVRLHVASDSYVGTKGPEGSFIHTIIYLMEGRTVQQKQQLGASMCEHLKQIAPQIDSLTVDVRELNKDLYQKANV